MRPRSPSGTPLSLQPTATPLRQTPTQRHPNTPPELRSTGCFPAHPPGRASMDDRGDPVTMQIPRARRSGLNTKPRDVLSDPFLKELLRVVRCSRKTQQVSVNTPKERAVAEVLFSLARMHRSSDGALNSPPPDDHDSTDHSPAILSQDPPYRASMNPISARSKPRTRKNREARNPQPYYGSVSDCTDSESELWKEPSRMNVFTHRNSNAHCRAKETELHREKTRARGSRRPRQSYDAFRDSCGDGNVATSSQRIGDLFGDGGVPIPRSKRSRTSVRKPIPTGSVWSGSSEGKEEGRVSRSSHTATEGKSCQEHGPSMFDYVRDLLVNAVPAFDPNNRVPQKRPNGTGLRAEKDSKEQEGPVPASLKRSFRRNSAHSYIAQFIRWHKHQSKEPPAVDLKQEIHMGARSVSLPVRGGIHTPHGQGVDPSRICTSASAANPPKQLIPVVWPTYLPNSHPDSAKPKANVGMSGSTGNGGVRFHRNLSVPYGPFSPFPSPLGAVQLQANPPLSTGNGDVKPVSGRGIVMVSGQNIPDGYRQ